MLVGRIRGSGPVAERLRVFVRDRVHKDGAHYKLRAGSDLAEHLKKPPSWVSEYIANPPEANADVDTALEICGFFGVNLADFATVNTPVTRVDQGSGPRQGGSDVPASVKERTRIRAQVIRLNTHISKLEARLRDMRDGASELEKLTAGFGKGRAPARRRA